MNIDICIFPTSQVPENRELYFIWTLQLWISVCSNKNYKQAGVHMIHLCSKYIMKTNASYH